MIVGAVAVVLIVGALWVKPWDKPSPPVALVIPSLDMPSPDEPTPIPTEPPTAAPTRSPVLAAGARRQCQSPDDWRMVTAERTVTRDTRTMYAASPVAATGPNDPQMPLSHLYAQTLRAVGLCVPRSPVVSPVKTLLQVTLWEVPDQGTPREVLQPVLLDAVLYDQGEAYFGPPVGEGPYWPGGRYVFEIKRIAGGTGSSSRWMGLEFVPTA